MAVAGLSVPFAGGIALDTTVTSMGSITYHSTGGSDPDFSLYYGVKASSTYHELSLSFGSSTGTLGSNTFTDGGSTTRTINSIGYSEDTPFPPAAETDNIYFVLDGGADTDTTFVSIVYNGVTYTRSSRSAYTALTSGFSWRWNNVNPNGPVSGNPTLIVNI